MKEESFKVDAFKERDDTGIIGRMTDILGNSMSTSKISIDGNSDILVGDPTLGLQVDVVGARGPDEFYKKDIYGIKQSIIALNNRTAEGSSIHSDLWSQNLIDSYNKSDNYLNMLDTVSGSSLFDDTDSDGLGRRFQMVLRLIKLREHFLRHSIMYYNVHNDSHAFFLLLTQTKVGELTETLLQFQWVDLILISILRVY